MSFKRTKVCKAALAAIGGAVVLTSVPAVVSAQGQTVQRIEITGSSIRRLDAEGSLPVQIFGQEDIARSGATSVTDFLQSLPLMSGFTTAADSVGGSGGGITTASIHDVGEQYTLVLLNGRRVAPANSGTTIDLNSIPLVAIERIEVLTDGASAIYGADAIAGVVNFILKQGQAPWRFDARVSSPQHGGGEQMNLSASKGFGDLFVDGYSAFVAASYDSIKQLKATDRDFAKTGIISGTQGKQTFDFFNGSSRSVPPNVDVRGAKDSAIGGYRPDGSSIDSISFMPSKEANGTCPADHVAIGRQCFFDYTTTVEIAPELERAALYATGEVNLGKSGWSAFGDFAYTDVSTIARIAPYPAEFSLATTHPYYSTYVQPYLTPAQVHLVTSVNTKYRLYDMGNRTYDYNSQATHLVGGLRGDLFGWDSVAALTYSKQKQDQIYKKGFPLADKFNDALNSQAVDPFPYVAGTMPANQLAALNATQYTGSYNITDIEMRRVDANAQRGLFKMDGGMAVLSAGFDYTQTGYKQTPNGAVANGEILFDDPQPVFDLSRSGWGAFGEMLFPVTKTIEAVGALRYDSMSGVTDEATNTKFGGNESATTFKIGGRWKATSDVVLRASYGTGFRTATMREIAQPKVDFGVTSGTYNCPFRSTYDPLGYFAAGYVCDDGLQKEVFQQGNTKLKPESSSQWNLGGVWQATQGFSVGLNFWSVEIEDAVSSVSEQLILNNASQYLDLYTTKYKSSNGLTYVAILDTAINIGKIQNEGIDWDFQYRVRTTWGNFLGSLAGTYLTKSRYTVPGTSDQWTDSLNKFGVNDAVSFRNVIRGSATQSTGAWDNTLIVNYRNGYTDQQYSAEDCVFINTANDCVEGALDVPSYTTFDWQTRWNATKKLSLTFGIVNLFDREPPRSLRVNGAGHQLGYDPRYASPYLRTFNLTGSLTF